jgi:ABC-2 type transport system permease protein
VNGVLRAELRKATATPAIWWLLFGTVAIGIIGTLAPLIAADDETTANLLTDRKLQEAMHGAAAGGILVIFIGIIGMAGEWRFGQATQTFLTTPQRWRVVVAKCISYSGVGAVYGVAAAAGATATAWAWYRSKDVALPLDRSAVWLTLLGCLAVAVLFGVLGVAIGAIVRNQVVAIVATLAWLTLVENALFAAVPSVFKWLPGVASFAVRRQPNDDLLTVGPAAAVVVGVITLALAAGLRFVARDDVTA